MLSSIIQRLLRLAMFSLSFENLIRESAAAQHFLCENVRKHLMSCSFHENVPTLILRSGSLLQARERYKQSSGGVTELTQKLAQVRRLFW